MCLQRQAADLFRFEMSRAGSVTLTQTVCVGEFLEKCRNKVSKKTQLILWSRSHQRELSSLIRTFYCMIFFLYSLCYDSGLCQSYFFF